MDKDLLKLANTCSYRIDTLTEEIRSIKHELSVPYIIRTHIKIGLDEITISQNQYETILNMLLKEKEEELQQMKSQFESL